jgi:ferric-dicitrate binding protein FerR (iron transport regulator)
MSKRILPFKVFIVLCMAALASVTAHAQNLASAKILISSGSVSISRAAVAGKATSNVKFRRGDGVFPGDIIKTNAGGRIVLGLADGSQAIIGENTIVEIKDLSHSPRTIFNILRGKTRIKIEKMGGKPNPYRVTTPTAVIAVRGTEFDVLVSDDETRVYVVEGEVGVTSLLAPEKEVILTPGQFTKVESGQPPRLPASFNQGRNDNLFSSRGSQNNRRNVFNDSPDDFIDRGNNSNSPGNVNNNPGRSPGAAPGNSGGRNNRRGRP